MHNPDLALLLGINGDSAGNYRFAKYDSATGFIVDLDGQSYDPTTGEVNRPGFRGGQLV